MRYCPEHRCVSRVFEIFFKPVHISTGDAALFTGYFEPEINGSRIKTDRFSYPVYSMPPELRQGQTWLTRKEIETSSTLRERGLEIAWVDDLADLFFFKSKAPVESNWMMAVFCGLDMLDQTAALLNLSLKSSFALAF